MKKKVSWHKPSLIETLEETLACYRIALIASIIIIVVLILLVLFLPPEWAERLKTILHFS